MAEPKKRMSVKRSKTRRGTQRLDAVAVSKCPVCGKTVAAHQTCRACLSGIMKPVVKKAVVKPAAKKPATKKAPATKE